MECSIRVRRKNGYGSSKHGLYKALDLRLSGLCCGLAQRRTNIYVHYIDRGYNMVGISSLGALLPGHLTKGAQTKHILRREKND